MREFEEQLNSLGEQYIAWLNFGRVLISMKLDELKNKFSAELNSMIDGKLTVPDEMDLRARGILRNLLPEGFEEEDIQIVFIDSGLSIFGLDPNGSVHLDTSKEASQYLLQLGHYDSLVFLDRSTSFDLFKTAS